MKKKLLSAVLLIAMALSLLPAPVLAGSAPGSNSSITEADQFFTALGGEGNVSKDVGEWFDYDGPVELPALVLEQDIDVIGHIRVQGRFILDLNGHTLNMGSNDLIADQDATLVIRSRHDGGTITGSSSNGVVQAQNKGFLELNGVTISGVGDGANSVVAGPESTVDVYDSLIKSSVNGIVVMGSATLNYYGTSVTSTGNGITTNGSSGPDYECPTINIYGGTIEATGSNGVGIYLPAIGGETVIYAGAVKGEVTGIDIHAGSLALTPRYDEDIVIEGGDKEGKKGARTGETPQNGGSVTQNAGVGIVPYGSPENISVSIRGGTISGSAALYCDIPADAAGTDVELDITSGVFKGGSGGEADGYGSVVVTEEAKAVLTEQKFISGGTFSSDVGEFVVDGKTAYKNGDIYTVIGAGDEEKDEENSVAQVGKLYYDTLSSAIEAAQAGVGDTVKLLKDIEAAKSYGSYTGSIDITKPLTLDLAGRKLDLGTNYMIQICSGAGNVIIKDSGGKGKIISSGYGGWMYPICVWGPDCSLSLSGVTMEYTPEDEQGTDAILVNSASVIIENGSEITARMKDKPYMSSGVIDLGLSSKLTVQGGTIRATGKNSTAIYISGVDMEGDTTAVNIVNGTIEAADGYAIYNSRASKINISGGTITGLAGIVARSGEIEVTGGTIQATGTGGLHNGYVDDYLLPPAGIVFDERPQLPVGKNAGVTITGGKIAAANGQHSLVYTKAGVPSASAGATLFTIAEGTYFLSGGKGDSYVKGYLANGLTIDETTGKVIKAGPSQTDGVYTITFDANGGLFGDSSKLVTAKTDNKGMLDQGKLPGDPTRSNYIFDNWYTEKDSGKQVNFAYAFTKDTTVYAHWKDKTGEDKPGEDKPGENKPGEDKPGEDKPGSGSGSDNTAYAIKIASRVRHGKISTSHTSAEQGTTVTLTVNPDADYALDWVEVEREDGQLVSLSQEGRRFSFIMPASDVTVNAKFSLLAEYNTFIPPQTRPPQASEQQTSLSTLVFTPVTWRPAAALWDLPTSSWAYPAAQWAYQNGYLNTAVDGSFRLNDTVSHIQMWRIMARWLGESTLDDISVSQWARKNGASNTGSASAAMTRQNMVEYLYRCYYLMGGDVSVSGDLLQYLDGQQIMSTSARNAWLWAVNKGIITGTTDGRLNPGGVLNRGEFAMILMRLCQKG